MKCEALLDRASVVWKAPERAAGAGQLACWLCWCSWVADVKLSSAQCVAQFCLEQGSAVPWDTWPLNLHSAALHHCYFECPLL